VFIAQKAVLLFPQDDNASSDGIDYL